MANEQHIVHKAGDWYDIGLDLPVNENCTEGFRDYIRIKSAHACGEKDFEFAYGETVTQGQAQVIREVAKANDIQEIKGGTAS